MRRLSSGFVVSQLLGMATLGGWLAGCSGIAGFPSEFSQMAQMVTNKVADQGVLSEWASNMNAHVNDPGVESGVVIRIAGYARIIGTDGEVRLDTEGGGTQLAPGEREALIGMLEWAGISAEERTAIMRRLGWHRGEGDTAPVGDGG